MDTVVLDQHSEPWVATFTGLWSVHVHADGNVDVTVAGAGSPDRPGCLIVPGRPNHTEVAVRSATLATDLNAINGWGEGLDLP